MVTKKEYKKMSEKASPDSNTIKNFIFAFVTGGTICIIGQAVLDILKYMDISEEKAFGLTSIILIAASALLTGLGLYEKLAKHAGTGTLVPITGFSNAVSSSALEARSEGYVLGVGAKIFSIAGPVILYGTAASAVYGAILLFI